MALLFDHKTCGRCGGSGKFSWCQMWGDTCFGCSGSGLQLTKKGKVAQNWFNAKKRKPASEVKIGDRIVHDGVPGFSKSEVVIVESVGWDDKPGWKDNETGEWKPHFIVSGKGAKSGTPHGLHTFPHVEVKMHVWGEAKKALIAEALAFQATLTKDGKVSKRKAKEKIT